MNIKKQRLDQLLVERGFAEDKAQAKRLIMAGQVLVEEQIRDKVGELIRTDQPVRLKKKRGPFVSRAGGKLAAALETFSLSPTDKVCLDLGASTGGFTDCLLKAGAIKVYAVDVGTNQLVWSLRTDNRVISLERTHARDLNADLVPEPIEILVVDVSFTSLRYVLPPVLPLLAPSAVGILLFKPQFEVAKKKVRDGGLVLEEDAKTASQAMKTWLQVQKIRLMGEMKSPVKGKEGNQEYLFSVAFPKH